MTDVRGDDPSFDFSAQKLTQSIILHLAMLRRATYPKNIQILRPSLQLDFSTTFDPSTFDHHQKENDRNDHNKIRRHDLLFTIDNPKEPATSRGEFLPTANSRPEDIKSKVMILRSMTIFLGIRDFSATYQQWIQLVSKPSEHVSFGFLLSVDHPI